MKFVTIWNRKGEVNGCLIQDDDDRIIHLSEDEMSNLELFIKNAYKK